MGIEPTRCLYALTVGCDVLKAGDGIRTRYIQLGRLALDQMSFTRIAHPLYSHTMGAIADILITPIHLSDFATMFRQYSRNLRRLTQQGHLNLGRLDRTGSFPLSRSSEIK